MSTELTARVHGTIEGKKEKLMHDLKGVVADADDLIKEVAGSTAEGFAAARAKVEGRIGEAKSRLDDARIAVAERASRDAGATNEYVRDNPWRVLGGVAAAALVIGFLLRRR